MKSRLTIAAFMVFATGMLNAAQRIPWKNSDFESNFVNWSGGGRMTAVVKEAAHSGKYGIRVNDDQPKGGSELFSQAFTVTPGVTYCSKYWARNVSGGEHVLVYHHYYDEGGKLLKPTTGGSEEYLGLAEEHGWKHYTFCTRAPEGAATLRIRVHSLDGEFAVADFDDFQLFALEPSEEMQITSTRIGRGAFPVLDTRRIKAISRLIPPTPQGIGAPASDRAAWKFLTDNENWVKGVVAKAEDCLVTPMPDTSDKLYLEFRENGNRSHYEAVYFRKRQMLNTLALAEALEYKGRFLPKLTEVIESILAERSWVLPAHDSGLANFNGTALYADLFCSATAAELAEIVWMLQEKLPPELQTRIREEAMRRALLPYRNVIRQGRCYFGSPWMTATNNWNAVCTRNMVVASQIFITDPMERAEFIAAAEVSAKYFAKGFTADGYCSEGVGYWGYGFGHFMDMNEFLLMESNGRIDLLKQNPTLTKACEFARNIFLDDNLTPCYADSGNAEPSLAVQELIQRHKPETLRKRVPPQLPKESVVTFALHAFGKPMADASKVPENPVLDLRSYFDEAGVLLCRADVPELGHFCAAIKGGHNGELHNHNDVGSYVISVAGAPLAVDPGGEVYTRRTFSAQRYESKILNSYGHDVPMAAGKLQSTGKAFGAKILAEKFTPEQDELWMDLTGAYEVPELNKLTRRFAFDRETPAVIITDEVDFKSPQEFETAIITQSSFRIEDDLHLLLEEKGRFLKVEIQAEGATVKLDSEIIPNPGRKEPTRIRVRFTEPVTHGRITVKYVPGRK